MKKLMFGLAAWTVASATFAEILFFDISPPGTSPATGLSPSNEIHMVLGSTGSGGEVMAGVAFNTDTMILDLAIGYGSIAGFTDLTGPATAAHIHGPAAADMATNVLVDLGPILVPAGDPARGGLLFGSVMLTPEVVSNLVAGLTYVNIHTTSNAMGEIRGQLILDVNQAPDISDLEPLVLECNSSAGAETLLSLTVTDADDDEVTVIWRIDGVDVATNIVAAGTSAAGAPVELQATFSLGSHEVLVTAVDPSGEADATMATVTVVDTTPPVIHGIQANPSILWPPNHRLKAVKIYVDATDACGPVMARIVNIASNEPADSVGDGHTSPDYKFRQSSIRSRRNRRGDPNDWQLVSPLRALLRAERSGTGSGRVYTISIEVVDPSNNAATGTVEITVPHDRGHGNAYGRVDDSDNPGTTSPSEEDTGNSPGHSNGHSNGNAKGKNK